MNELFHPTAENHETPGGAVVVPGGSGSSGSASKIGLKYTNQLVDFKVANIRCLELFGSDHSLVCFFSTVILSKNPW